MGDRLEHRDFCLWDSGHDPSSHVLFWTSWSRESRTLLLRFRHAPFWDSLRSDPRFEQIVASFATRE
jgi:hypothetical protein